MSTLQQSLNRRRSVLGESNRHLCYSIQPEAPALTIRAAGGEQWVLPWTHFVFARHQADDKAERLLLTFTSHEVLVRGDSLVALADEVAGGSLESLCELPTKYRDRTTDEPFVESIRVRALNDETASQG